MSVIREACARILNCLQKYSLGDAERLQPGLSRELIEEKARELAFPLPEEIGEAARATQIDQKFENVEVY